MKKRRTVRKSIFISNALMVLLVLVVFAVINVVIAKVYEESIEADFRKSIEGYLDDDEFDEYDEPIEGIIEDSEFNDVFEEHRNKFILLVIIDVILCVAGLIFTSWLFTLWLTCHIMKPLDELTAGADRIQANDLTRKLEYTGDAEFEDVCGTFNDMQQHILDEQEKNRKYKQARTDMIAGISHDLRTPLTAIRGTVKGLMDGVAKTPEQQNRFLSVAYQRTEDMDVLLAQLFYLSKLETGNMPIAMQDVELVSYIQNYTEGKRMWHDGADAAQDDGTPFAINLGQIKAAEIHVMADPEQLQRVFDNLLENSRKYAESDSLEINIALIEQDGQARICFSDNGVGVPEDKLPHIFDEFYRADESRNRKEGNGLGLYIVKYLMEAMGGNTWAENVQGGGLAVYMNLPIIIPANDSIS